jgi:hypothetical protein
MVVNLVVKDVKVEPGEVKDLGDVVPQSPLAIGSSSGEPG